MLIIKWFNVSIAEAYEIVKKCAVSFLVFLEVPSAMFVAIDEALLFICDVIPYISLVGNRFVNSYITIINSREFYQTSNFSNEKVYMVCSYLIVFCLGVTTRVGLSHSLFYVVPKLRERRKKSSDNCSIPHAASRYDIALAPIGTVSFCAGVRRKKFSGKREIAPKNQCTI